ncbi:MAG: hypothetical protein GX443_03470 [Deltaproteobacteria bacterium]|nr:hypothetical protein [Deltaproteobacteria bacterium]
MRIVWKSFFVIFLCGFLMSCAGKPATTVSTDSSVGKGGVVSPGVPETGMPSIVVPETHFSISDSSSEVEISHDFRVKNVGTGVLLITKITPG